MAENDLNFIWNQVIPVLEKSLNKPIFETLISSTKPVLYKDGRFEVAVPSEIVKEWLSKHCVTLLEQELQSFFPDLKSVSFFMGPEELFSTPLFDPSSSLKSPPTKKGPVPLSPFLNPRYTFETFVVGQGNRFAHAAALAVSESPATAYNPFFLYGGVGLGKTHLMQAIGHKVTLANPKAKILYTTSEMFTNEVINAIRDDRTIALRNKYRHIDILMVDDVQFIAGKERTQEEFFHTFNALYESNKQIVVSSDRPPKEITTLEERLRSRFEWGLTADIQPPDFETRVAILKKKAEISGTSISDEILSFIASKIASNIRKLEGALIRVVAYASLNNVDINITLVEHVIKDILLPQKDEINLSIDLIKKVTAEYYGLQIEDMNSKVRTKQIALARQVAMYLTRDLTGLSLPKIGESFGGRDHTTVIHACEKMKGAIKSSHSLSDAVREIKNKAKKYTTEVVHK